MDHLPYEEDGEETTHTKNNEEGGEQDPERGKVEESRIVRINAGGYCRAIVTYLKLNLYNNNIFFLAVAEQPKFLLANCWLGEGGRLS